MTYFEKHLWTATLPPEQFYKNNPDTAWFCEKFLPNVICQLQNNRNKLMQGRDFPIIVDFSDISYTDQNL